jgi:pimeloyl-ACP methyl ester carboxylesterase
MQERVLESRGIAYQTNEWREGRATLVLIHGFSSSLSIWEPFVNIFYNRYNLLTYDLRGCGKSLRPQDHTEYALPKHVEDLRALLEEVQVGEARSQQVVLVGFSYGALVAMEYARQFQSDVSKAVFVSPIYGLRWRFFVFWTRRLLSYVALHAPQVAPTGERIPYSGYQGSDQQFWLTLRHLRSTGAREYFWELQEIYSRDVDRDWKSVTVPSTIVHGARDSVIPLRYAVILKSHMSKAKLIVVEDGNHMLTINSVAEVSEAIRNSVENY